ncbi:MAG: hypothetical protein QFF03_16700 [Pseudomonadota bacterium]|nr:hypothetical protein [Pseudomonadota bacterium]
MRTTYVVATRFVTTRVVATLSTVAVLACAADAAAQAVPLAPGESVLPEIQVVAAQPRYPIRLEQARAVRGIYEMSNGWVMEVNPDWRRVYVAINGRAPVEMVPVSPDKFVSADRRMAMEFNLGVNANEVVLRYLPEGADAAGAVTVTTATLAQR